MAEFIGGSSSRGGGFKMPEIPLKMPGRLGKAIILVVILVILVGGLFRSFFVYVQPNQYGIKEVKIGVKRGIREKVYEPGLAFVLPFGLERMHLFPRDMQVLELTAFPSKPPKTGLFESVSTSRYFEPAAKIQTSDGFYVDVDVTILYRIADAYRLITSLGPGRLYLDNGILPKAEPILKEAFGELTTEDFYNSPMRVEKAQKSRDLLDAELTSKGIHVEHVLVRYFMYSDEIQKNIEEKKLQDQLVFKNQAEAKAAMEEANLKRITREGEMRVKVTLEEGNAYKVKKDAERELYVRKKEAEADLLVKLAEAQRMELKNEAMQVAGSDKMVAMKMAEVLEGLDTIIVSSGGPSGLNPLDLDQLLELFGAEKAKPGGAIHIGAPSVVRAPPPPPPPAAVQPPPSEPVQAEVTEEAEIAEEVEQ